MAFSGVLAVIGGAGYWYYEVYKKHELFRKFWTGYDMHAAADRIKVNGNCKKETWMFLNWALYPLKIKQFKVLNGDCLVQISYLLFW